MNWGLGAGQEQGAARLRAIKAYVMANLASRALSVQAVARQQALTPRYVHMIFEGEGSTFSAFVLQQRLMLARSMLVGRRYAGSTVSEIAFAAGFGDISHFNRSFRRRFGATPTQIREAP